MTPGLVVATFHSTDLLRTRRCELLGRAGFDPAAALVTMSWGGGLATGSVLERAS